MMKNVKNFGLVFLAVLSVFGHLVPQVAFAQESKGIQDLEGFYIATEEIPEEAILHVQNFIGGMLNDLAIGGSLTVGMPFKLSGTSHDLYYFIVYSDDKIVGVYRVYETEVPSEYTGIFGEDTDIIDGLESIRQLTSFDKPARIAAGNHDDIYAFIGSDIYPILEDFEGNKTDTNHLWNELSARLDDPVVDVSQGIEFRIPIMSRSSSSKFLQIGWAETQGSLPWCMAYTTASVVRFKTGKSLSSVNARKVMEASYPNLSKANLEKQALSTSKAEAYGKTHKLSPKYTTSRRTYAQIKTEIDKHDSPVIFIMDNLNTGAKRSHAFVARGYNDNNGKSFYSVWNPWYTKFERVYTSDNTYVNASGSARYKWSATMYNWR